MTSLTIALAVLGGLVLAAVVAHGAWQARQAGPKRAAQQDPRPEPREPVLDDPAALALSTKDLPALWASLLERGRDQAPVIRGELFRAGRVVDHRRLDYRSPAWAVSSLAYSRAVKGAAATWLAAWREARGDTTRTPRAREVRPEAPRGTLAEDRRPPSPEAP